MPSSATASTDNSKQHDQLRKRLQSELQTSDETLDAADYDWFLRGASTSPSVTTPIHSPSLAASSNSKALPSLSTTNTKAVPDKDNMAPLRRARTVDVTTETKGPEFGTSTLARSSTNVMAAPPVAEPKKHGFFHKLFGEKEHPRSRSSSVSKPREISPESSRPRKASISRPQSSPETSPVHPPARKPLSEKYKGADPKLYEYLKDIEETISNTETPRYSVFAPTIESSVKYAPDEIPPHPDKPKLPSAFALHPKYDKPAEVGSSGHKESKEGVLGSLLRISRNKESEPATRSDSVSSGTSTSTSYTAPPPKHEKSPPIKVLKDVKPIRKVAFATTTFINDPPQQIPSRHPRKGNVEVGPDGELVIHKINPEDQKNAAGGIVVGGSGHLRLIHQDGEASAEMGRSSSDLTINRQDKDLAAQKARTDKDSTRNLDDIKIDKPMVKRKKRMEAPVVTLKLDELYTRCCHLREILPIPATLKQIPKGTTEPLALLQLRNPYPSLIEVLSFADFVRIAPINCVSLDGVHLTLEMFRIILASLLNKRYLEKLSLRNTPIDQAGWKSLCWFLSMNNVLRRLDLTQCPSLELNVQKLKRPSKDQERMQCNVQNRSDMDWSLMTATLMIRGGMKEMVLSGCKINDLDVFKNFLKLGLKNSFKIGLAYNELTLQHCEVVVDWMSANKDLVGIDLGYNDLSSLLRPFIDYTKRSDFNAGLSLLSLNSCNLLDSEDTVAVFDSFSKLPHLKYLDVSNNRKLFQTFMNKFVTYLPLFPDLTRLNLDGNDFTPVAIIQLSETLPLLKKLNYLSIKDNRLTEACCESICRSLKYSKSLFNLDFDPEGTPAGFQERIGLLTMRNMERTLYGDKGGDAELNSLLSISPGEKSFTQLVTDMLKADINPSDQEVKDFFTHAHKLTNELQATISELAAIQLERKLSFEGKETLIRLLMIRSSLEKCVQLIRRKHPGLDVQENAHKPLDFFIEGQDIKNPSSYSLAESDTTELNAESSPMVPHESVTNSTIQEEASTFKESSLTNKDCPLADRLSSLGSVLLDSNDVTKYLDAVKKLKETGISIKDLYSLGVTKNNTLRNRRKSQPDDSSINEDLDSAPPLQTIYDTVLTELDRMKVGN
ncbi:hypothetical protein OGAPHI_006750 [Ogataea philodendri]|uniref:Uncharacterized protein n=1 Tax=Ogataea philodendri TaxID=1378263 RepID=A0A9P8NW18_9ASCO|nr:uncharacterized protein OGAPHI_006750 [Ogataea philodendri]KAH3661343.1 hypothetical protein OGAPHI_006750 [Ogataea philodendri]